MSNPPAVPPFEHRVGVVAYLLAAYIVMSRDIARAATGELHAILTVALCQARQDIFEQPSLRVPWSTRLSAFWDIYRGYFLRAGPTFFHKLIFMWLGIVIGLPIYLLLNIIQVQRAVWLSHDMITLLAMCLPDHLELSRDLHAAVRNEAQQLLAGLTQNQANWMVVKIAILAVVVKLLGLLGM